MYIARTHFHFDSEEISKLRTTTDYTKEAVEHIYDTIDFCAQNDISAGTGELYVVCKNSELYIFMLNPNALFCVYDLKAEEGGLTDIAKDYYSSNGADIKKAKNALLTAAVDLCYLSYSLITQKSNKISLPDMKNTFYSKITSSKYNISAEMYFCGHDEFDITRNGEKVIVFYNGMHKYVEQFPSETFPMPNEGKISCFHKGNTKIIEDDGELGRIMNGVKPLWNDITDAMLAQETLEDAGYAGQHSVKYYAGWAQSKEGRCFSQHAWLVVDGRSVVTPDIFGYDFLKRFNLPDRLAGEYDHNTAKTYRKIMSRELSNPKPFTERCRYGDVLEGTLLIGVKCTPAEAADSRVAMRELFENSTDAAKIVMNIPGPY